MRVLLTGGAGFIGSHVAENLFRSGAELSIVDNLDPFYSPEIKRANVEEVKKTGGLDFRSIDICDFPALRAIFQTVRPNVVIHLAARAGVRPSIENPRAYQETNVGGTQNVLELCREFRIMRLIFGSSSSVYGASSHAPFSEEQTDLRPISPYAATKLAGESLCHVYAHLHKLPVVCLRFFTVYGPRQRPDLAIHKFTSLIEAGEPVPVYGDGETGRDYTWCGDIVSGIRAAIESPLPQNAAPFAIYNLGNSSPVTLNQMIREIEIATGREATRQQMPMQPGDVPLTWADISKARAELGYEPTTEFSTGIAKFVAWYRENAAKSEAVRLRAKSAQVVDKLAG